MVLNMTELAIPERQQWLQTLIAPRPIGLVSTINNEGAPNLAPFSFFNLFSANPPIIIFAPARRVRDNTCKHSFTNLHEVAEVVINLVDYAMIHQVNIASADYEKDINEFTKAGLTMESASIVKPFLVKESKAKFECRVLELKHLGTDAGAGTLVICEVLCMHVNNNILAENGIPDYSKFRPVARLGSNWYCEINKHALFELEKPAGKPIGFDKLPQTITKSVWFNNAHCAKLATAHVIPAGTVTNQSILHEKAASLLDKNFIKEAWALLMT